MSSTTPNLTGFLELNTSSKLVDDDDGDWIIEQPWGDASITINVNENDNELISALNNTSLHESFSGIWHKDTGCLEIIYAIIPKSTVDGNDLFKRKFKFKFEGLNIECSFEQSSRCLEIISKNTNPAGPMSATSYRNLSSFFNFNAIADSAQNFPDFIKDYYKESGAWSFFIRGIPFLDENVVNIVNHLNFYMTYYDSNTPTVLIHSSKADIDAERPRERYILGDFPEAIEAQKIDGNLLNFWQASEAGDAARRFLYNYQILEYSSFYVLEDDIQRDIRRIVGSPHASANVGRTIEQIIEVYSLAKMAEPQKFDLLLKKYVNPEVVWREIENDKDIFSAEMVFEGGFSIQPLINRKWNLSDFKVGWVPALPNTLRNLRNALSHGREQRMAAVITPTQENLRLLRYWVPIVAATAREVMIYRHRN